MSVRNKDLIRWKCIGINKITFQILSMLVLPSLLNMLGITEPGDYLTWGVGCIGFGTWNLIQYKYEVSDIFKKLLEDVYFTIILSLLSIYFIYYTIKNNDTN